VHLCSTQSEVVVPLIVQKPPPEAAPQQPDPQQQQQQQASQQPRGRLLAVLDVDSNHPAAFDEEDAQQLEALCSWLADKFGGAVPT
jgi:putative methionine-R-sulfoxide reductase with GAF domain